MTTFDFGKFDFEDEFREIVEKTYVTENKTTSEFSFDDENTVAANTSTEEIKFEDEVVNNTTLEVENKITHEFSFDDEENSGDEELEIKEFPGIPPLGSNIETDKYLSAIHRFTEYMPLNLSIDRHIPSNFESLVDYNSDEQTIVIEKLQSNIIPMLHNFAKRPVPAMLENKQPVIKWEGNINEFIDTLEEELTLRLGLEDGEFKAMKKIIIVENMNEKVDLYQNETYITRQDVFDLLLNKYDSIIDLTESNCSINFVEGSKKYNLNIGGLGYGCDLNSSWIEEIKYKIEFLRPRQILLTGIASNSEIVRVLKDEFGFNIVNDGELRSLAIEI